MSAENTSGNGAADTRPPGPVFELRLVFLRDLSFESPHVPGVLFGHEQPELTFSVESGHRLREKDLFEVSLDVTVHATAGDKSLFIIEVKQGGLFEIRGYPSEETMALLRTRAPEALYPYARELIASLVSRGGFPRLQLRPINFEAHYAEAQRTGVASA
ncbi:MAG: protein-export chaperone SecB [Gammaproteobacteria bacterium]|nr:MAG: protein-export chaperone SecB [Gammaproteobacteria bacterium]